MYLILLHVDQIGVYFDVLHTRVMIIGRLEDDFPRRRQDWGHSG